VSAATGDDFLALLRFELAAARQQHETSHTAAVRESEAAFSRAFKRLMGESPGAARRQADNADRDAF
jgi:hypothetical protein